MKLSREYWKPTLHRICSAVKQTIYYIQELACIYQRQDYGYCGWRKVPGGVQNTLYELWSCVCQRNWETTWDMIKRTLQRSQKHYRSLYQGRKKQGKQASAINLRSQIISVWDGGRYQLSHVWDKLLPTTDVKNQKSVLTKTLGWMSKRH